MKKMFNLVSRPWRSVGASDVLIDPLMISQGDLMELAMKHGIGWGYWRYDKVRYHSFRIFELHEKESKN